MWMSHVTHIKWHSSAHVWERHDIFARVICRGHISDMAHLYERRLHYAFMRVTYFSMNAWHFTYSYVWYVYIYICIYLYICIYKILSPCIHVTGYTCIHMYIYMCIHVYVYLTYIHIHIYTYMYVYTCISHREYVWQKSFVREQKYFRLTWRICTFVSRTISGGAWPGAPGFYYAAVVPLSVCLLCSTIYHTFMPLPYGNSFCRIQGSLARI